MENNRLANLSSRILGLLLVMGLGIALHLTWHHENSSYGDPQAKVSFCPENGVINCDVVNTSRFSEILGMPIALFAIPTYLFLLLLLAVRGRFPQTNRVILGIGVATSVYSLFLAGVSYFQIGYACLWCMGLYAVNFATLLVGILNFPKDKQNVSLPWGPFLRFAIPSLFVLTVLTVSGQKIYRATLKKQKWVQKSSWKFQQASLVKGQPIRVSEIDLQSRVGNGKPLALIYEYPGLYQSELFSSQIVRLLQDKLPEAQIFFVAGFNQGNQVDTLLEDHLGHPAKKKFPLLLDRGFVQARGFDLPRNQSALLLMDKEGAVLANQIAEVSKKVVLESEELTVSEWLSRVSKSQKPLALSSYRASPSHSGLIGKCAPAFSLPNLADKKTFYFDPQKIKKPTLLVFWSPKCGHCRAELPKLVAYHQRHRTEFDVVSISRFSDLTMDYAKSIGLQWPVLNDSGVASFLYRVDSTPTTILISKTGRIEKFWKGTVEGLESVYEGALREVASSPREQCGSLDTLEKSRLEFSVVDVEQRKTSVASLISKPTLVHLWATWCLPCQEELPQFLEFAKKAKAQGIDSLLVTVESVADQSKVLPFIRKKGWTGPVYFSPEGGVHDCEKASYSIPRTYAVNGQSELLKKYLGAQDWENDKFQELVNTWFQNRF